ncbi:MAG TPA: Trm112 family protein [Nitrososphaeraceae archaeon]
MKKSMLNILACPIDKHYPLELFEFTSARIDEYNEKEEIIDMGLLYCIKCTRFYPIIEQIPVMLPDELRDREKDLEFLQRWRGDIPTNILHNAMPWHL